MYTHEWIPREIRDGRAGYGAARPEDRLAGAGVLADLATAQEPELPMVLARYAALRAWLLRRSGAPAPVVDHAVSAADAYLERVDASWPEREALARLSTAGLEGAGPLLDAAAASASAAGHRAGAQMLRREAWRLRRAALRLPPPSPS